VVRVRGRVRDRERARELEPAGARDHGPFTTETEANEVARARMWSKIDIYAHKARVVDLTE
jgi:hypothetical protein